MAGAQEAYQREERRAWPLPPVPEPEDLDRLRTFDPFEPWGSFEVGSVPFAPLPASPMGEISRLRTFDPFEEYDETWLGGVAITARPAGFGYGERGGSDGTVPSQLNRTTSLMETEEARTQLARSDPAVGSTAVPLENLPAPPAYDPHPDDHVDGPGLPKPQALQTSNVRSTGAFRVRWTVDARKLTGADRVAVSPPFQLSFRACPKSLPFRIMLYPKVSSGFKGGASFRRSGGVGFVQLKCEADVREAIDGRVAFCATIGPGRRVARPPWQPFRGPFIHDFANSGISTVAKGDEEWNFATAVDAASQTFSVCLDVLPSPFTL